MTLLEILAHPEPASFNHALAEEVRGILLAAGHEVMYHDLYGEDFPPVLPGAEIPAGAPLDPQVARHCRELSRAEGLILVHPNWWGQPPALLKGWVDRVFRPGVAYRFQPGDGGAGVPEGLLTARTALIFNTGNTPPEREREVFGDPLETLWTRCILNFCGVRDVRRRLFATVADSNPEQRRAWIREARDMAADAFPA